MATGLTPNLYIFGTAGEGYSITDDQFASIAKLFYAELTKHRGNPMLGVIDLSLGSILQKIEVGRDIGFREFQISLPSWGPLSDLEVDIYFEAVCGKFPDCRFFHYNVSRAKRILRAKDYGRLSERHPNLVGIKLSPEKFDEVREIREIAPRLQMFLNEFDYVKARQCGIEPGLLISLATANYAKAKRFFASEWANIGVEDELKRILEGLTGAVKESGHMDGVYDKMLHRLNQEGFPLRLLPPYTSATEEQFEQFKSSVPAAWSPSGRAF